MPPLSALASSAVKLRWGRPLGRSVAKLDITDTGGKDNHCSVARIGAGSECTVCTTTGLCSFGISETTFFVDSAGDAAKPTVVGFVAKDYYAFDAMMSKDIPGSFGVNSKGELCGFDNVGKGGNLAFATGDKITIKLDFLEGLASISIEAGAGKKKASDVVVGFDPRAMHNVCFPACSLGSNGAAVSIDQTVDLTELDGFVKKLTGGAHMKGGKTGPTGEPYLHDAFGSFWMRLFCRMKDSDSVKVTGQAAPFKKDDVMAQMLLCGCEQHSGATAVCVAQLGECPAIERQRAIFFAATNGMFFENGGRAAGSIKEALSKAPLPIVGGQGGSYSPFAFFAAALVNYMDSEKAGSIKQIEHMLLSLGSRVDSLDGGKTGSLPKTNGAKDGGGSSFLPDISAKAGSVAGGPKPGGKAAASAAAPAAAAAAPAAKQAPKAPAPKPTGKKTAAAPPPKAAGGGGGGQAPTGNSLMLTIRALKKRADEIHQLSQRGSPTDDDLKKLENAKVLMCKEKQAAAKTLQGMNDTSAAIKALDDEAKNEIMDFFEDMVGEGDHIEGNTDLAHALFDKVPIDWSEFVGSKHLDAVAAYDGSMDYLELFLSLPGLETDTVDLMQNAMFNQSRRIPAVLAVLKHESILRLEEFVDEIHDTWQDFFEDICSNNKSIPKEDRTGRMDLIMLMVHHPLLTVDPMKEGGDGQTVFSRAAKEGDIALMKLLLKECKIDANKASTDTTTALIQAVVANEVEAVKLLLSQPKINVGHVSQEGSALFLSRALHRDPAITKALESAK